MTFSYLPVLFFLNKTCLEEQGFQLSKNMIRIGNTINYVVFLSFFLQFDCRLDIYFIYVYLYFPVLFFPIYLH